jgi:hypothetical protein
VPTASLCTTPFVELAHRQAEAFGMPELPVVLIAERLADRTMAELEALIDQAFRALCAALVESPTAPG